jgi:hypothetical protein
MQRVTRILTRSALALAAAFLLLLGGCSLFESSGSIELSLTDAPVDADGITGVYITIEEIQYPTDGGWQTMTGYDGGTYNLLELTGGKAALLGTLDLTAGEYEQIRFILGAPDEDGPLSGNPGSWVNKDDNEEYNEGTDQALFVPSGAQTGYKATAEQPFVVPANGTISLTADFDVRKALVDASNGYILKPVLRIVADNEAGEISGTIDYSGSNSLVAYAYEADTFSSDEVTSGDNGYDNAVTSAPVANTGSYTLAYLAEGTYDIVVAQYDSSGEYVNGSGEDVDEAGVSVTAGETTADVNFTEND